MKKYLFVIYLILHFNSIAQIKSQLPFINVSIDSTKVLDTVKCQNKSNDLNINSCIFQKLYFTYEIKNSYDKNIKFPIDKIVYKGIDLSVEYFSESLKKYVPLEINNLIFESPEEIKYDIIVPKEKLIRHGTICSYFQLNRKNRIRFKFLYKVFNEDVNNSFSNWIELTTQTDKVVEKK